MTMMMMTTMNKLKVKPMLPRKKTIEMMKKNTMTMIIMKVDKMKVMKKRKKKNQRLKKILSMMMMMFQVEEIHFEFFGKIKFDYSIRYDERRSDGE